MKVTVSKTQVADFINRNAAFGGAVMLHVLTVGFCIAFHWSPLDEWFCGIMAMMLGMGAISVDIMAVVEFVENNRSEK